MAAIEHLGGVRQQEHARLQQAQAQQAKTVKTQQAQKVASVKQAEVKRVATAAASEKRKAAAPTRVGSGKTGVTDYLSGSEEDFDSWYNNLQNSQ
jgi:exopolysaccharide biosynthesis protein